jgi:hypothetical protein
MFFDESNTINIESELLAWGIIRSLIWPFCGARFQRTSVQRPFKSFKGGEEQTLQSGMIEEQETNSNMLKKAICRYKMPKKGFFNEEVFVVILVLS